MSASAQVTRSTLSSSSGRFSRRPCLKSAAGTFAQHDAQHRLSAVDADDLVPELRQLGCVTTSAAGHVQSRPDWQVGQHLVHDWLFTFDGRVRPIRSRDDHCV